MTETTARPTHAPYEPPDAPPPRVPGRAAFAFIFVTVCLDMLALGVMIPVLPKLIVQFEGGDVARAARITGWFGLTWAAMQFLAAPVLGALSDRYGRRPVVLLSNLGLGLDYVLMALAPSVGWLFVGRVISGITTATYPTASAYVADVTPPEQRAAKFGMLGAAFGLGFIVGPAVGGVLGAVDLRLPFWIAAALSVANAAYGAFVLPESLPPERRTRRPLHLGNPLGALGFLREHRAVAGLAGAAFLYYLAHEASPSIFVLYTSARYGWSARAEGWALAGIGVCSTIVSAGLIGPVVQRLGERRAMTLGFALGGASSLAFALAATTWGFVAAFPLAALAGFGMPSLQASVTRAVPADAQGRLQGALSALQGIALMAGPPLFTEVFAAAIRRGDAASPVRGAPYAVAAALFLGSAAAAWWTTRSTEHS